MLDLTTTPGPAVPAVRVAPAASAGRPVWAPGRARAAVALAVSAAVAPVVLAAQAAAAPVVLAAQAAAAPVVLVAAGSAVLGRTTLARSSTPAGARVAAPATAVRR
jgi:hypothetical protein